jgi:phosphohistidine phosphatase
MRVIFLRHGIAAELSQLRAAPGAPPPTDDDRPLTELGRRRVRQAAKALAALHLRPDWILHSGLVRAHETADLVAERLRVPVERRRQTDALRSEADPKAIFPELAKLHARRIVCVGHAPHVDRVVALAVGAAHREVTELGKAGAACLELPDSGRPAGRIVWLLPPKMLRKLRG